MTKRELVEALLELASAGEWECDYDYRAGRGVVRLRKVITETQECCVEHVYEIYEGTEMWDVFWREILRLRCRSGG